MKIKTEEQYEAAIAHIEALWEAATPGTPEHDILQALVDDVHEYEESGGADLDTQPKSTLA